MKKINKIQKVIAVIMLLVIIGIVICMLNIFIFGKNSNNSLKKDQTIKFDYISYSRDTDIYKQIFNKLKETLDSSEIDYNKYAEYITELFVIDFYTIDNKNNKNDIGGLQFIKKDMIDNFKLNATNTVYKYIENISNRDQELPVVKSVSLTKIESSTYKIDDNEYTSYVVNLNWEYTKDLGYDSVGTFTLIKDGEQLYIVEKS